MNCKKLLEQHPVSKKVIKDWFMKEMLESLEDDEIPESFKDHMLEQGIQDDKLSTLIDLNPRMLFDIFDSNNVIIEIFFEDDLGFSWKVGEFSSVTHFETRKEAEKSSVKQSFEILENLLKEKV